METDPLLTTLLDLDAALPNPGTLITGGGYGLFRKQLYLQNNPQIRTLFELDRLPRPRTTQDIDLILQAEIVTDSQSMKTIKDALDQLGFKVVETAKYTQFDRTTDRGKVKIDLLAGPLGELAARVPKDTRRVRPRPSVELHASKIEEALAVDRYPLRIPIAGKLSTGINHQTTMLVPQAFSYLLMKLSAFRDRLHDPDKNLGQHHALDIYRIVGLLTQDEDANVRELATELTAHPIVMHLREIAQTHFVAVDGIGRLRIREHPLYSTDLDLDQFGRELEGLLAG